MDHDALRELVAQGESETIEFKKSTKLQTAGFKTLCAFLNGHGGYVLFGVSDSGRIQGQDISDRTLQSIAADIRKLEPVPEVEVIRVHLPGSELEVLVLQATSAPELIPFTYDGRAYQRVATATSRMPQELYQRSLMGRSGVEHRWEIRKAEAVSITDLAEEQIVRTMERALGFGRISEVEVGSVREILMRFGLLDGEIPRNAAIALFGTSFMPDYPQCLLKLTRFRGEEKIEALDSRQIHGNVFELLTESIRFIERHLPIAGRIEPGLFERIDEPLFPLEALREALVNAFCHRDYEIEGGSVDINIFDSRLEVWSSGCLPLGIQLADLKRDHPSKARNPLIADVLYKRGLVERWGRGTQRIVELCTLAGHPEPEFLEQAGCVGVRFFASEYIAPHQIAYDLSERQRRILTLLSTRPLRLGELCERLDGIEQIRSIREDLYRLRDADLIECRGQGRGAKWYLREL